MLTILISGTVANPIFYITSSKSASYKKQSHKLEHKQASNG